jgi:predicted phosphate transport protein (TIGR00153 family)
VRLRLTPRDSSFYEHFAVAARNLVEGGDLLHQLVDPDSDRLALAKQLRDVEHHSDEVTHTIMRRLNSTFVTPFDREDIYRLANRLDDVMDHMEAAADLVVLYELGELPPEYLAVVQILQAAARATADAMPRLRRMRQLEDYWIEVNRLENEADQIYRHTVARLFDGSYDALTALKLKDVADELEAAADALEDVADTVETIVVKES